MVPLLGELTIILSLPEGRQFISDLVRAWRASAPLTSGRLADALNALRSCALARPLLSNMFGLTESRTTSKTL